jgi:hypothetical protein
MACPSPILIPTQREHKIRRRIEYEHRSPDTRAMLKSSSSDWALAYFEHLNTPDDVLLECIYLSEKLEYEMEDMIDEAGEMSEEFRCHFEMVKNSIVMGIRYYISIRQKDNTGLLNRMTLSQLRLKTLTDYFHMPESDDEEVVTLSFDGDLVVRGEVSREVVVRIKEEGDKLDDLKVKVWEEVDEVPFSTFRELILFYFKKRYGVRVVKVI